MKITDFLELPLWVLLPILFLLVYILYTLLRALPGGMKTFLHNQTFNSLDAKDKNAVIRIWLEVIEADGVTSGDEISAIPSVKPAQFAAARELSFDAAIDQAKLLSSKERKMLLDISEDICGADGAVASQEEKVLRIINESIPCG